MNDSTDSNPNLVTDEERDQVAAYFAKYDGIVRDVEVGSRSAGGNVFCVELQSPMYVRDCPCEPPRDQHKCSTFHVVVRNGEVTDDIPSDWYAREVRENGDALVALRYSRGQCYVLADDIDAEFRREESDVSMAWIVTDFVLDVRDAFRRFFTRVSAKNAALREGSTR